MSIKGSNLFHPGLPAPLDFKKTFSYYARKVTPRINKATAIVLFLVIIAAIAGGAYYWGSKRAATITSVSPTPTLTLTPIATITAEVSATITPTKTKTPSPTPTKSPIPSPTPTSASTTLNSNGDLDGFRSSNGGGNATLDIRVGRNSNLITRGFVSFDIPSSLNGKVIEKASLRLYQAKIIGAPYTAGSSVKVDHLDYGNSLENADYSASSLSSSFATLTSNPVIEWKDADVTDQLKEDLANNRQRSQYRIHLAVEDIGGDVTGDFAYFESANNSEGTGNTPQLVVKYH